MSDADHVEYFQSCADVERELASMAPDEYISRIHLQMAALYDALARDPERHDDLKGVCAALCAEMRPFDDEVMDVRYAR